MNDNKLQIISFLDKCRWNNEDNYYTINYSKQIQNDMDSKMLTHWISYITDRQMPFEPIWDVGGYIFSRLVYKYKQTKDWEKLLELEGEKEENKTTFFKIDERNQKKNQEEQDSIYAFAAQILEEDFNCKEKIDKKYINDDTVYFKSRFIPNDYMSIYRTLYILDKLTKKKSFIEYIELVLKTACTEGNTLTSKQAIEALANGLYFLTYADGKGKEKDWKLEEYINVCKNNGIFNDDQNNDLKEKLKSYIEENQMTRNKNRKTISAQNYDNKRLWCSIRDYLKSKEFCGEFETILEKTKIIPESQNTKDYIEEMKRSLELPGDVWNNNTNFSKCLFSKTEQEWYYDSEKETYIGEKQQKIKRFNQFLRQLKETKYMNNKEWYPEQFDVTFNLASNLCSNNKCDICPLGDIRNNKIKMLCIGDKISSKDEKYCPVVMNCCGYKFKCPGKDSGKCPIIDTIEVKNNGII